MTTEKATKKKPLWLLIEEEFLALEPQAISGGTPEERYSALPAIWTARATMCPSTAAIWFNYGLPRRTCARSAGP